MDAATIEMEPFKANEALYIKLGSGGSWERDCIEHDQTLRLGYNEIPHELCLAGEWERVRAILKESGCTDGVATFHRNQIKRFYEEGPEVLWVTFFRRLFVVVLLGEKNREATRQYKDSPRARQMAMHRYKR